jgi:hypothetical protein
MGPAITMIDFMTDQSMMDVHRPRVSASECQGLSKAGFGFRTILLLSGRDCLPFGLSRFPPRRELCP